MPELNNPSANWLAAIDALDDVELAFDCLSELSQLYVNPDEKAQYMGWLIDLKARENIEILRGSLQLLQRSTVLVQMNG